MKFIIMIIDINKKQYHVLTNELNKVIHNYYNNLVISGSNWKHGLSPLPGTSIAQRPWSVCCCNCFATLASSS